MLTPNSGSVLFSMYKKVGRGTKAKDEICQGSTVKGSYELYINILTEVIQSQVMPDCDSVLQPIMVRGLVIWQFMRNKSAHQCLAWLLILNKIPVNENRKVTEGLHQICL